MMVVEKHTSALTQMVTKPIDLGSDTIIRPTESMRAAMASDEVDDDVLCHDPTALQLEKEVARIMGKEEGLFVPSGTMENLISVLVHCDMRGSEVCLSKGLGAPVGSVIVDPSSFITKARRLRKALGGGMRQIGGLCAAVFIALHENVSKLENDLKKAKSLADSSLHILSQSTCLKKKKIQFITAEKTFWCLK